PTVAQDVRTTDISADQITLYHVVRCAAEINIETVSAVARKQIGSSGGRSADYVIPRVFNAHAIKRIALRNRASCVRADEIALNDVATVDGHMDAPGTKSVDDQTPHCAVSSRDLEPGC